MCVYIDITTIKIIYDVIHPTVMRSSSWMCRYFVFQIQLGKASRIYRTLFRYYWPFCLLLYFSCWLYSLELPALIKTLPKIKHNSASSMNCWLYLYLSITAGSIYLIVDKLLVSKQYSAMALLNGFYFLHYRARSIDFFRKYRISSFSIGKFWR